MPTVLLKTDQKSIEVSPDSTLVKACAGTSTSILFGCRDGACGSCLVRVVEGESHCLPPSEKEMRLLESIAAHADERLACQLRVTGDIALEVVE